MPHFNINSFKAKLEFGGARANLFEVSVAFPASLGETTAGAELEFLCKATSLPEFTLGVAPVNFRGRVVKFAGDRTFADWTLTVVNDEDFLIRNAFERWSDLINNMEENQTDELNSRGYMTNAKVRQLGKNGDILRTYNIVDMFPISVAAIPLSYDTTDTIEEFDVTLSYQYHTVVFPSGVTN